MKRVGMGGYFRSTFVRVLGLSVAVLCSLTAYDSAHAQVKEDWRVYFNSRVDDYDLARGIVLDPKGYIYVTGACNWPQPSGTGATIKYDSDGHQVWVARHEFAGSQIALDPEGNVIVAGINPSGGSGVLKYRDDGQQIWSHRYSGTIGGVSVDPVGNVCVTGGGGPVAGASTGYFTVKHDSDGNLLWSAFYSGVHGATYANAIAVDQTGNVYVTGASDGPNSRPDYATIKYDSDGNELWVARYNGPGDGSDIAYAIGLDENGHVIVTGSSSESGETLYLATIKYDADGNEMWVARYHAYEISSPGYAYLEVPFGMAVSPDGSISIGANARYHNDMWRDASSVVKYDGSGREVWVVYPEQSGFVDMAADGDGSIYITAARPSAPTIKYDANGEQVWMVSASPYADGSEYFYDEASKIAVDATGNAYVTGYSRGRLTNGDYVTIKYSASNDSNSTDDNVNVDSGNASGGGGGCFITMVAY